MNFVIDKCHISIILHIKIQADTYRYLLIK